MLNVDDLFLILEQRVLVSADCRHDAENKTNAISQWQGHSGAEVGVVGLLRGRQAKAARDSVIGSRNRPIALEADSSCIGTDLRTRGFGSSSIPSGKNGAAI